MSRKTIVRNAGAHGDECTTHIQNAYKAKKYDVERSSVERRGGRRICVTINNARSPGGTLLRGIAGVNVCGTLKLRVVGNDLHVKVAGKFGSFFTRLLVMGIAIALTVVGIPFLLPLLFTAIIGFFMQMQFLDGLYNDTLSWMTSRGFHQSGGIRGDDSKRSSVEVPQTEGQVEFRCPSCRAKFSITEDSEGYQIKCPGCGKVIDLTELNPL